LQNQTIEEKESIDNQAVETEDDLPF